MRAERGKAEEVTYARIFFFFSACTFLFLCVCLPAVSSCAEKSPLQFPFVLRNSFECSSNIHMYIYICIILQRSPLQFPFVLRTSHACSLIMFTISAESPLFVVLYCLSSIMLLVSLLWF